MDEIIIAQETPVVKTLLRWADKRATKSKVARKMIDAGYEPRGYRMLKCGDQMAIEYCNNCGTHHVRSTNLCRDKMCPVCRWRLALKRYAQMIAVCDVLAAEYPHAQYNFLTLTVRNCKIDALNDTMRAMSSAWNRMLQRKLMRDNVCGWARSVEVTYNKHTGEVHPHYHVICMHAQTAAPITAGAIAAQWRQALRIDYQPIIDIRDIKQGAAADVTGAVCETFKYATKDADLMCMPLQTFSAYVSQMTSMRTTAYGGIIRQIRAELGFTDRSTEQINTTDETIISCPRCGADMQTAIFDWSAFDSNVRDNGLRHILQAAQQKHASEVAANA